VSDNLTGGSMATTAVRFASLLNGYLITVGPPKTITIPGAAELAKIQQITVRGTLLKKQFITWNPKLLKRQISIGKRGGRYVLQDDGSLEFCLGVNPTSTLFRA